MPAPVERLHSGDRLDIADVGFVADGSFLYAFGGSGSHWASSSDDQPWVATWRRDGTRIGRFAPPDEGKWAVAPAPFGQTLIIARGGRLSMFDAGGQTLCTVTLPEWARASYNEPKCMVAISGRLGLVQQGRHAWLFEGDPAAKNLVILRVLTWVADRDKLDSDDLFHGAFSGITGIALDSDGQRALSISDDGTGRCWALDGELRARLRSSAGGRFAAAEFLAGGRIATGTMRGQGEIWTDEGQVVKVFRSQSGLDLFIPAVDSRGENFVTASNDSEHALEVWNRDGERQVQLAAHRQHYWCADFSPDDRFVAAGCGDGAVRVWEWREARLVFELHGHTDTVNHVAFSRDGTSLVSCSHDGSARFWQLAAPILPTLRGHSGAIRSMIRTDGRLFTSGQTDDMTLLWMPESDPVALPGTPIDPVAGSPVPSLMLTATKDGDVRLWEWRGASDVPTCRCIVPRVVRAGDTRTAAISPDGDRFVLAYDTPGTRGAELWSADGQRLAALVGSTVERLDADRLLIVGLGFGRGTRSIVTGAQNGMVWLWAPDGTPVTSFVADRGSPDALFDLVVDPLGEFILTAVRNSVGLWNWRGELIGELNPAGYKVFNVFVSPDGSRLLTISDNPSGSPSFYGQLWNRDGRLLARLDAPGLSRTPALKFDVHRRYVLLRSGADLRIFDFEGQLIGLLAAARGVYVNAVAVSPDGNLIGCLFSDGIVRIWSMADRRRIMSIDVSSPGPFIFNSDGRRLLIGMPSGNIEQHALDISDLYAGTAGRLDRSFNLDEIRRFAIPEPVKLDLANYAR
jgi:WD40 repeat protein